MKLLVAAVVAMAILGSANAAGSWPENFVADTNMTVSANGTSHEFVGRVYTAGDSFRETLSATYQGVPVMIDHYCTKAKAAATVVDVMGQHSCTADCLNGDLCPSGNDCDCEEADHPAQINQLLGMASEAGPCRNAYGDSGELFTANVPGQGSFDVCIDCSHGSSAGCKPVYYQYHEAASGTSIRQEYTWLWIGPVDANTFAVPSDCSCMGESVPRALRAVQTQAGAIAQLAKGHAMVQAALE